MFKLNHFIVPIQTPHIPPGRGEVCVEPSSMYLPSTSLKNNNIIFQFNPNFSGNKIWIISKNIYINFIFILFIQKWVKKNLKNYSAKENMMKLKMMKSSTIQRTAKKVNYRRIKNMHKFEVRKIMLKSRSEDYWYSY